MQQNHKRAAVTLVLGTMISMAIVASGSNEGSSEPGSGRSAKLDPDESRRIEHAFGESRVPREPERVAALGQLASTYALELGVVPVVGTRDGIAWTAEFEERFEVPVDVDEVPTAGRTRQIDVEAVAAADPDLILTAARIEEATYAKLAQIAPTVVAERGDNADWKRRYDTFAAALGEKAALERLRNQYQATLDAFPADHAQTEIAFIRPRRGGEFRMDVGAGAFPASVARDAGLPITEPPKGVEELWTSGSGVYQLSAERMRALESADVIVFPESSTVLDGGKPSRRIFAQNPLWERLPAVENGRVIPISGLVYNGGSYTAATMLIEAMP